MNHPKETKNHGPDRGLAAAAITTILLNAACVIEAKSTPAATPPKVGVVAAEERDIPLEAGYTGRVEAIHTVELRPRVSGALEQILFKEGGRVSRGAPLFRLDQRPFTIALERTRAEVATVQAQLTRANEEMERAQRLVSKDAVSVEELQRRQSEAAALKGRLDAALAAFQEASLNLEFTTVTAPVNGQIGRAEVTEGNLVTGGPGQGTRLGVLHSMDPLYVYFELDPATASKALDHPRTEWRAVVTPLDGGPSVKGPIDFVDNSVGVSTGTQKVRVRVPNRDGRLLPGSVVRVAFRYGTDARATVVPERTIGTDQGARFVLVTSSDGTVEYRPVTLGSRAEGWRAVSDAVRPGEKVVLPGLPGLRPGMKVTPVSEVLQ